MTPPEALAAFDAAAAEVRVRNVLLLDRLRGAFVRRINGNTGEHAMSKEVMQQALEALEAIDKADDDRDFLMPAECGRLFDAISALREAIERDGWQPIETAPRDGSLFLCWVSAIRYGETDEGQQYQQDASQIDFCSWRDGPPDIPGHGYFDPCCGQIADSQDVTHWRPLPPAPKD